MPTSCGYTLEGERFTYLEAKPFLELEVTAEQIAENPHGQEVLDYFVRGARKLSDRWTVGLSFYKDAVVFRCWIPAPPEPTFDIWLAA